MILHYFPESARFFGIATHNQTMVDTIHLSDTIHHTGDETMKTARQQLIEKIEGRSTETLIELAKELNLKTTTEEMIVSCEVERAIEKRLSAKEFVELMESLEAELMTA